MTTLQKLHICYKMTHIWTWYSRDHMWKSRDHMWKSRAILEISREIFVRAGHEHKVL